jgi:hypothetical protein
MSISHFDPKPMLEKRRNVYPRQNQTPPLSGLVWGLELVDAKDWRRRCPAAISSESSVNVADNSFSGLHDWR